MSHNNVMQWSQRYSIRSYLGSSLWMVPFLALVIEQIALQLAIAIDDNFDWMLAWPLSDAGTTTALQTIITLSLSFLVFTFGSILVAIQVASGQLTPRLIATTLLRDNVIRITVGLFVFTLLFAIGAVSRMNNSPSRLVDWTASLSGFLSIGAFLYLIDHSARLLRPVSVVCIVGERGNRVIEAAYPHRFEAGDPISQRLQKHLPPDRVIYNSRRSAIVIAVNVDRLRFEAQKLDVVVELVPRVGDFVGTGEPLLRVYGVNEKLDEDHLRGFIAFGSERTIEQDPTFALRVIVDIAIKALSEAINDPTTAVVAIDQLQRLLHNVGERNLHHDPVFARFGYTPVVLRSPNWDEFVQLAIREVRYNGAGHLQVARRLRAMLTRLIDALPASRSLALALELELLDQSIELAYPLEDDRKLARVVDMQGLGGASDA